MRGGGRRLSIFQSIQQRLTQKNPLLKPEIPCHERREREVHFRGERDGGSFQRGERGGFISEARGDHFREMREGSFQRDERGDHFSDRREGIISETGERGSFQRGERGDHLRERS